MKHPTVTPPVPANRGDHLVYMLVSGPLVETVFWILDIFISSTDAKTYHSKDPMKVLASHEEIKKKKHLAFVFFKQ